MDSFRAPNSSPKQLATSKVAKQTWPETSILIRDPCFADSEPKPLLALAGFQDAHPSPVPLVPPVPPVPPVARPSLCRPSLSSAKFLWLDLSSPCALCGWFQREPKAETVAGSGGGPRKDTPTPTRDSKIPKFVGHQSKKEMFECGLCLVNLNMEIWCEIPAWTLWPLGTNIQRCRLGSNQQAGTGVL